MGERVLIFGRVIVLDLSLQHTCMHTAFKIEGNRTPSDRGCVGGRLRTGGIRRFYIKYGFSKLDFTARALAS